MIVLHTLRLSRCDVPFNPREFTMKTPMLLICLMLASVVVTFTALLLMVGRLACMSF